MVLVFSLTCEHVISFSHPSPGYFMILCMFLQSTARCGEKLTRPRGENVLHFLQYKTHCKPPNVVRSILLAFHNLNQWPFCCRLPETKKSSVNMVNGILSNGKLKWSNCTHSFPFWDNHQYSLPRERRTISIMATSGFYKFRTKLRMSLWMNQFDLKLETFLGFLKALTMCVKTNITRLNHDLISTSKECVLCALLSNLLQPHPLQLYKRIRLH